MSHNHIFFNMPFRFINSIASWWFSKRLSDLRLFIKNPVNTQEEQLYYLLEMAADTRFGKQYNFHQIKNIEDYRQAVPLQSYETLFPYIEAMMQGEADVLWHGKVKWFAKSSGTTSSRSKFIPVTQESLELNHFQGGKDVIAFYLHNYPGSKLLQGKTLKLGGSKKLLKHRDAYVGDLSAIMIDNMPFWANMVSIPEKKTALLADWEEKLDKIINEALRFNLTGLAGVPSWMLMFLKEVLHRTGKSHILEVWPQLEVFFHGGVSFTPYRDTYRKLFPGDNFHYMEIYNASEGFFALQDRKDTGDLLLMLDYGIFYEFIPMSAYKGIQSKKIVPLKDVEPDVNYAMVISTNAGLWRYIIGDTVRFTSVKPYRIKITGRTKHFVNAFGEEVVIENADRAIEKAAHLTGAGIKEYTLAPVYMQTDRKGAHQWLIEFDKEPDDFEKFKKILDETLQQINSDYAAKRYKDMTMQVPVVTKARHGLFYEWQEKQGKLGGQNKVPRLRNDRQLMEELLQLNQKP